MKIQFAEKKVSLPENVLAYANKKVSKLDRYFREEGEALVAFSVEKGRNKVELTVHAANTYFRASESTSDMFASIDAVVTTIERQIRKNKTRLARRIKQDAWVKTAGGSFLLCAGRTRRKENPNSSDKALPYEADDAGGSYFADESAGPYILCIPG